MLRHFLEGNTRRPAGRSTGKRRTHPRQARTHTVGVASDPPVECFAVDGGEMRADIAQKAEKSRVTDVRVLRPSERAPENGTLALTRCPAFSHARGVVLFDHSCVKSPISDVCGSQAHTRAGRGAVHGGTGKPKRKNIAVPVHIRLPRVGPVPAGTILGFLGVSYRSFLQAFLPPTPKTRLARRCPRSPNFVVLPSVPKFTANPPRLASDADHWPVHPPSPRRLPVLRGTMLLHRRRRESLRR